MAQLPNRRRSFALAACTLALLATSRVAAQEKAEEAGESAEEGKQPIETVTVTATRSGKRVQDEPIHVEVIDKEEIEESATMTPGEVAHLLSETNGIHLQVTSPSLGAANLSIQGLRGHYTQVLSDGLPLYGGQTESLSLLQIPPSDLGRVEVIKGVASALYGPSALGGVINLVSRRPEPQLAADLLLNATSLDQQDAVAYFSGPLVEAVGFTVLGGLHRQGVSDLDHDGWADLPGYNRAVLHPRLFWDDEQGDTLLVTGDFTKEARNGGTLADHVVPDGSSFPEKLDTLRLDLGAAGHFSLGGARVLNTRTSVMGEDDSHVWGDVRDNDHHGTWFGEVSFTDEGAPHTWTVGTAIEQDVYRSRNFGRFDYTYTVPSLFVQDEYDAFTWLTLAASVRFDFHSVYGTFVSPRLSGLARFGDWTVRATVGAGNYAPTPFTEETADTGLSRVLSFQGIKAERARAASIDVGRVFGAFEINASVFGSIISNPVRLTASLANPGKLQFVNASGATRPVGTELLARYKEGPFTITGSYTLIDSTEIDPEALRREEVDLTPKHVATFDVAWEKEDFGRFAIEGFYTGRQSLNDPLDPNPYRTRSVPFFVFGALAELNLTERLSLFLNAENLTDVRQTHYDPLVRPTQAPDGRWTVDAWAPLDGRVINGGLRARF